MVVGGVAMSGRAVSQSGRLSAQSADALSQNKKRERENSLAITMAAILY